MGSQERVHRTLETEAARESAGQGRGSRSRRVGGVVLLREEAAAGCCALI